MEKNGQINKMLRIPLLLFLLLAAMNVGVYLIDLNAGFFVSIALLLYLAALLVTYFARKKAIQREFVQYAAAYGKVQSRLMTELSIPYAVTDARGSLLWFNAAFEKLTGRDHRSFHKSITSLFSSVTADRFPEEGETEEYEVTYGKREFRMQIRNVTADIMGGKTPAPEETAVSETDAEQQEEPAAVKAAEQTGQTAEKLLAFFLFDETELNEYIRKYEDETMATGLIYIDNYDEALEGVEDVRRSLLTALIDRKISKYFADMDGIVKKYEKDKYFLFMRNRSLAELKKLKFNILEEVKTVNIGNDLSVTLSIGIGANNGSYQKNADCARIAIDLALGRGGDQAVLRDGDSITYFGGKTAAVEKSTRVKARVKAQALREFIDSKENVVIMGHRLFDIDCFGSAVGLYRACTSINKKAHIVIDEPNVTTKPFITEFRNSQDYDEDLIITTGQALETVDDNTLLIVVDTNKPDYTECEKLLHLTKTIVVLDHHRQGNAYIRDAVLSYIEPYASSSCEMVAEILQYFSEGLKLRNIEADALYAGIMVDTSNFIQRTGVRTFEAAAFLRRCGADVTRGRKLFREDLENYKAKGDAIRNVEMYRGHYAISECSPDERVESPTVVASQAANQLLDIRGVKASFVLTLYNGVIYISARSIDEVNVQVIMERLGGGGHMNMAGAQFRDTTIEEAASQLKKVLDEMIDGGEIG